MLTNQELQSSTLAELLEELKKAKHELIKIQIGVKTKHIKETTLKNNTRKYIARIKTFIKEMDLEAKVKEAVKVDDKKSA